MRYGPNNSRKPITPPYDRFKKKIYIAESGCWEWLGYVSPKGYGTFFDGEKMRQAHGWSYEFHKGPISPNMMPDHLCRNRKCVNPDHLEEVTNQENCARGDTGKHMKARGAKITHCPQGHEYTLTNTRYVGTSRRCGKCSDIRHAEWYKKNKDHYLPAYNARRREKRRAQKTTKEI